MEANWISVKDRLPETAHQPILIFNGDVCEAVYDPNREDVFTEPYYGQAVHGTFPDVTHWMPLPAPPLTNH